MATVTITRSYPVNQPFASTTLQVGLPIIPREKQLMVHTLEARLEAVEKRLSQLTWRVTRMEEEESCRDTCITTVEVYSRLGYGVSSFFFFCAYMTLHLFDAVLQNRWFRTLPQSVKEGLKTGPSTNRMYIAFVSSNLLIFCSTVPRALTSWWILWNHTNPTAYPLP
jgi:hypothetical protein